MGHSMALRMIRSVFHEAGVPQEQLFQLSYNSCRHFLPTACNILQFDRQVAQAVGSWVETDPTGAGGGHLPACPMSIHYSDARATASGFAKLQVITKLVDTIAVTPGRTEAPMGAGVTEEVASLSWHEVAAASAAFPADPQLPKDNTATATATSPQPVPHRRPPRRRMDFRPSYKDR